MSKLTKLDVIKLWANDLAKSESIKDFFFWVVGSIADKEKDAKDFDIIVSGPEDYQKIKAVLSKSLEIAEVHGLPLDITYWSTPPIGIPKNSEIRAYKNGHVNNGAQWAKKDLKSPAFENLDHHISRVTTYKYYQFRSDINVMEASIFLYKILHGK